MCAVKISLEMRIIINNNICIGFPILRANEYLYAHTNEKVCIEKNDRQNIVYIPMHI